MNGKQLTRRYLAHLGAILTHFGIVGIIYCVAALFSGFIVLFYLMFLLVIALGTLFLAFTIPEYRAMWDKLSNLSDFVAGLANSLPYVIPVSLGLMAIALFLLLLDKDWHKSKSRIVTNIVVLSILVVIFVIFLIGAAGTSR